MTFARTSVVLIPSHRVAKQLLAAAPVTVDHDVRRVR
jgi:hypothetical protein